MRALRVRIAPDRRVESAIYDPKRDATSDAQRFAQPGETIFQHVHRVVEEWRTDPQGASLVFRDLPAELKRDAPSVYGAFSDESLGTIMALVWIYLGGRGTVNDRVMRKWLREAIDGSMEAEGRGRGGHGVD